MSNLAETDLATDKRTAVERLWEVENAWPGYWTVCTYKLYDMAIKEVVNVIARRFRKSSEEAFDPATKERYPRR